jgi:heat shock protein HslJ
MQGFRPMKGLLLAMALGACAPAPVVPEPAAAAAPPLPALAGTRWVGKLERNDDGHNTPRLEFASGGELLGYTGCNMLGGRWSESAGEVRLTEIYATKRMCLGAGAEVEKRFLAALSSESRITRTATSLTVTSPRGARFEFAPAATA